MPLSTKYEKELSGGTFTLKDWYEANAKVAPFPRSRSAIWNKLYPPFRPHYEPPPIAEGSFWDSRRTR